MSSHRMNSYMSQDSFWISVHILLSKPHVVNKRLWGCKTLVKCHCINTHTFISLPLNCIKLKSLINFGLHTIEPILHDLGLQYVSKADESPVQVHLVELLPKNFTEDHAYQLVCLYKECNQIVFYDVTPEESQHSLCPNFSYYLQLCDDDVVLYAECDKDSKSYQWLTNTVLTQFIKWGKEAVNNKQNSLTLVDNEKYYTKYNELKSKYGREMVKIWPECTDPSKFVYEDVAIATYILLLWEDERRKNDSDNLQTFADLGCGNGLLVYILAMEGHNGVGLDVRKRNIWDIYPSNVKLEEKTVTPSDLNLFPETDWLIGNHSDELTPWIPVVAARSSYKCNFFLLPCCSYNFDGSKYQRKNSSKSQYTEYLDYIRTLTQQCGFKTEVDRLKIPSTKRICIVGQGRTYNQEEHNRYCNSIQNVINLNEVNGNEERSGSHEIWIQGFKARDPVEKVRNCTQVEKGLIDSIVTCVTKYLLEGCSQYVGWSPGKTVDILELVELIPVDDLKSLKAECGGLQTLLKNHHHIFRVQKGKVQLRHPKSVEEINIEIKMKTNKSQNIKIQQKPCWFYSNHPQGCPLTNESCSFLHVKNN